MPGRPEHMLKASHCELSPPKKYPGKYGRNNQDGTLMTKGEWIQSEAKVWVDRMKNHESYDASYFSVKVDCLLKWLKKTFHKITTKEIKAILYELEEGTENPPEVVTTAEEGQGTEDPSEDVEQMEMDYDERPKSPDMFDSDEMEEEASLTRVEKENLIKEYAGKIDKDIIEREDSLPEFVKNSRIYKQQREEYIAEFVDRLFDRYTSQDIANSMSQLPNFIQSNMKMKDWVNKRSKVEMSNLRVLKTLNETCKELQKNASREAYEQRIALVAGVTCPRYGVPDIDETQNVIAAAKKLKKSFFGGEQSTLRVEERKKREIFPQKVFEFAMESWEKDATIPEPAQHQRPGSAITDGNEKLPARLQVLTNDEAYEQFKDNYKEKVHDVMKEHCEKIKLKYEKVPDNTTKLKILESLSRKEYLFPGKTWFLQQKPPQTKANKDHSTGLCKDCQEGHLNYETLLKFVKKTCDCRTDRCPNYVCICQVPDDTQAPDDCYCSRECECQECLSCQVKSFISFLQNIFQKINQIMRNKTRKGSSIYSIKVSQRQSQPPFQILDFETVSKTFWIKSIISK